MVDILQQIQITNHETNIMLYLNYNFFKKGKKLKIQELIKVANSGKYNGRRKKILVQGVQNYLKSQHDSEKPVKDKKKKEILDPSQMAQKILNIRISS